MIWRRKKLFVVTGLFVFLILLLFFLSKTFPGTWSSLGSVFWKVSDRTENILSSASGVFISKNNLIQERENLEREISKLKRKILLQPVLESRLENLNEVMNIKSEEAMAARVLSRPPHSPYDTFIIERGLRDGVKRGDGVFAEKNFIIGTIIETHSKTSKAKLLSNPGDVVEVELGDGVYTEAVGRGGGSFIIEIPREVEVRKDDPVILPGSETAVLGFVEEIESKSKDPFKKIYFNLPFNMNEIKWVLIYPE